MFYLDEWKASTLCRKFMILFENKFNGNLNLIDIAWEDESSKRKLDKLSKRLAYELYEKLTYEVENNNTIDTYLRFLLQDFLEITKNCIRIMRLADKQKLSSSTWSLKHDIIELMRSRNSRHLIVLHRYSDNPEVIDHERVANYPFLSRERNNSSHLKSFKNFLDKKDYKLFKKRIKLNNFMIDIGRHIMKFNIRFAISTIFYMIETLKNILPQYASICNLYHNNFKSAVNRLKKQYSKILIQIVTQKKNLNIIQKNRIIQRIKSKHNKFYYKGGIFGRFIVCPLNF